MSPASFRIRSAISEDASVLANIYNYYIDNTCVTFETEAVPADSMAERIAETHALPLPWLVAEESGHVLGYAYASKWKGRCAYRFAVETTIYVDPEFTGKGIGKPLYVALIDAIKDLGMHAVIGGIALPNDASVRLHESLGFEKIGHFKEVGFKQDQWVDVGYWQRMLNPG